MHENRKYNFPNFQKNEIQRHTTLLVEPGIECPDWHMAMYSLRLQRLPWIYCNSHARVGENERADGIRRNERADWQAQPTSQQAYDLAEH